jgi:beta-lactamase regulating signal transducer with metallopeptidase domain
MIAQASQLLLSPSNLLWLVGSMIAITLVFGALNRRRARLTESLREFVDRTQTKNGSKRKSQDENA